ncbi:MAG: hypothetical protein HQK96_20395 [Nitrospirae bacterium]|nr:hypothetical protein [Nitrospirota bacterium]
MCIILWLSGGQQCIDDIKMPDGGSGRDLCVWDFLKDGCDECDAARYAGIAFNFGKDGKFTGAVLIKLMSTRQRLHSKAA